MSFYFSNKPNKMNSYMLKNLNLKYLNPINACSFMYKGIAKQILANANAEEGDLIEVKEFKGILMPKHEFSAENILIIKLSDGYNVGVKVEENSKIKILKKKEEKEIAKKEIPFSKEKETIAILSTGGTIASYIDYRTGAVHPALTPEQLVFSVPDLIENFNIKAKVLFSILSEDMKVEYWQRLAREVAKDLNEGVKAVIIPHGTDTIGFTASALSFMLRNLNAPIILVGSQRSSDRPSSDAYLNLLSSIKLARTDLAEVVVVMHGKSSDDFCYCHRGTKVRKMHSSSRDAFKSINALPIAKINNEIEFLQNYNKRKEGKVQLMEKMEENVSLVYFYPGLSIEHFEILTEKCKGIVIAGTGLGHVASYLIPSIKKAVEKGKTIVMTTQCFYGRVNMNVYSNGRDLIKAGVISGEDMLPETAYVKLMWVLGNAKNEEEIKELMGRKLVGE